MSFMLSDEGRMVRDSLTAILQRSMAGGRALRAESDAAVRRELSDAGVLGIIVPESHGGSSMQLLDAATVAEQLASFGASIPFLGAAVLAPIALKNVPGADALLSELAVGGARVGIAISSDLRTGALSCSGKLSGEVDHAIEVKDAAAILVTDQAGSVHLLACDAPGLGIEPQPSLDAGRSVATLRMDGAPATCLGDHTLRDRLIAAARVILAAETLGASAHLLACAVTYSRDRQQFGRPVGSFQAVKHLCAELAAAIEASRALVAYAAWSFDDDIADFPLQAMLAKSHLDEVGNFVARRAIEVHGAIGLTDEVGLHRWWKRIAFNRSLFGTPEVVRQQCARLQSL